MKVELDPTNRGITDAEILADLRNCAEKLGRPAHYDGIRYAEIGEGSRRYCSATVRFVAGGPAPRQAEAESIEDRNIGRCTVRVHLRDLWTVLGRQPRYSRDRTWPPLAVPPVLMRSGLVLGLEHYVGLSIGQMPTCRPPLGRPARHLSGSSATAPAEPKPGHRTQRCIRQAALPNPFFRDGFTCTACGASPLKSAGTELHIDHILPWSRGGETVDENLTTKCKTV